MKKLMIAALAVAGMSAFAAEGFDPNGILAAEKVSLTLKQVNEKVDSIKYNGFVFWDTNGVTKAYVWDTKDQLKGEWKVKLPDAKKETTVKKAYVLKDLGEYDSEVYTTAASSKQGKSISFGKDYLGYGSGKMLMTIDMLKQKAKVAESVSGNMVNQAEREYGTWKMSYDSSTTKLIQKGYTVKDVLNKNKVEVWEL